MLKTKENQEKDFKNRIAKTLANFNDDPLVERMLDRSSDLRITLPSVLNFWKWDLFSRKAGLAYDGSTTLDMAVVLCELKNREAIIDLHKYESFSANPYRADQKVDHRKKRFGKLLAMVSNQKTFKFSVRVWDENVVNEDGSNGDYRVFNITDFDGEFSESWKNITFDETAAENAFLEKADVVNNHTIEFNDFISPNRWTSFYGCAYWKSKLMIKRLQAQIKHLKAEEKRLVAEGIQPYAPASFPTYPSKVETKGIKVECFEADLDMVADFHGDFITYSVSDDSMDEIHDVKKMLNKSLEYLRFVTRATEFAFYEYGGVKTSNHLFPAWIKGVKWEVEKIKRTEWMMLHLNSHLTLRFRTYMKKENVKLKFDDSKYEKA
jgi:hypothetical protein